VKGQPLALNKSTMLFLAMKEHEIRQRIEGFLKRTARELVVPASMGLGLALVGCDHTGIKVARDAAAETAQSVAPDAADAMRRGIALPMSRTWPTRGTSASTMTGPPSMRSKQTCLG